MAMAAPAPGATGKKAKFTGSAQQGNPVEVLPSPVVLWVVIFFRARRSGAYRPKNLGTISLSRR